MISITDHFNTPMTKLVLVKNKSLHVDETKASINAIVEEMNDETNSCLNKLYLTNFNLDFIPAIADALTRLNCSLECLTLEHGVLCEGGAQIIAAFIASSRLQKLEILKCAIRNNALVAIINASASANATLQVPLQILNLRHLTISEDIARVIANLLDRSSLTKLSFYNCTIGRNALVLIMGAVKKSELSTLILDNACSNDEETIAAIVDCILWPKLIKLSLSQALFMDAQPIIIEAIKQSSHQTLDLQHVLCSNKFDMMNDLLLHSRIAKIKFSQYMFSAEENIMLLDSILRNNFVEHISFNCLLFTDKLLTKICGVIESSHLTSFGLRGCSLSNDNLTKIIDPIKLSSITSFNFYTDHLSTKNVSVICDLL